jgi:hypothetical protein
LIALSMWACGTSSTQGAGENPDASAGADTGGGSSGATGSSGSSQGSSSGTTSGASGSTSGSSSGAGSGSSGSSTSASSSGASSSSSSSGSSTTSSGCTTASTDSGSAVLMYHKHINRDGFYIDGALTTAAIQGQTLHLDSTFSGTLSGVAGITPSEVRTAPLYSPTGYGGNPTFYVVDESNNVYALSASTGAVLKAVNLGAGLTGEPCFNNPPHHVGIRGTPAIDPSNGIMVLDAATGGTSVSKHTIYGIKISDLSTAWSVDVSTVTSGSLSFAPSNQNQRSAVLIVGGKAYLSYGGFIGDCGTYHGWVVGVNTADGSGAMGWATPSVEAGIWGPAGPASDGTMIYVATGNPQNMSATTWQGGFSLVRFSSGPTFSGSTNDYFWAMNDTGDQDLGGSAPLVITAGCTNPYVVQLGKDGDEYLLDTSKPLGGRVSPSLGSLSVMKDEITTAPAWATISGTTYVAMVGNQAGTGGANCPNGTSGEFVVTTVNPTATTPIATAWCGKTPGFGAPIITTSNGTNDAFVWTLGVLGRNDATAGDMQLHAYNLATGASVNTGSDTFSNVRHFATPIVVDGRIFVAGDTRLYAYKP